MCGKSCDSLTKAKISQAELDVCDECVEMGTAIEDETNTANTETKYSTNSNSDDSSGSSSNSSNNQSSNSDNRSINELRADFGDAIRNAREEQNLTLAKLANELNEKESHLRHIEQENRQPTESLQEDLEHYLDVELSIDNAFDELDESSNSNSQTLGDVADFDV